MATNEDYLIPDPESSTCTTGLLPHILNGMFIQLLRHHFSNPDHIIQEPIRNYVWDRDDKVGKISIENIYRWNAAEIQERPAIVARRGPLKTRKLSIGNIEHGSPEEVGYTEDRMIVGFTGSHSFFCMAGTGAEAEQLGAEVAYEMLEFSQIIRRDFNLASFDLYEIGQVARLDESHDHFAVPVTVAYSYFHSWRTLRETPIWMTTGRKLLLGEC